MKDQSAGPSWLRFLPGLLLILHATLAWIGRAPGILTRQDDSLYVILARSLLQGTYRDLHRIDAPLHALYPPGYPAELAAWGSAFGFGTDALILFSILCSTLALALVWHATARSFSPWLAIAVLVPLVANPLLLEYAGNVAAEAPYMLLTAIPLWLAGRPGRVSRRAVFAIAAFALAAALTRAVGVALLGAVVLHWGLERRWRAAAVLAVIGACMFGGWLLWSAHVSREAAAKSYVAAAEPEVRAGTGPAAEPPGRVRRLSRQVPRNTWYYAAEGAPWAMAVPTIPGTRVDNAAGLLAVVGTGLVGLVLLFGRWRLAGIYLLVYSAVLIAYPWLQARFVVPIVPFAVLASLAGGQWLASRFRFRWLRIAVPVVLSLAFTVGAVIRSAPEIAAAAGCERDGEFPDPDCILSDQASWFEAVAWMKANLPEDAVVLTMKPEPLFQYTGIRSIGVGYLLDPPDSQFVPNVLERGAAYILLGSLQSMEPGRLSRRMLANCDALSVEAHFPPRTWLFRVAPPDSESGVRASCKAMVRYRFANIGRDFASDP